MSNLNKLGFIALALSAVSGCGGGGGSNEPGEVVTPPPPLPPTYSYEGIGLFTIIGIEPGNEASVLLGEVTDIPIVLLKAEADIPVETRLIESIAGIQLLQVDGSYVLRVDGEALTDPESVPLTLEIENLEKSLIAEVPLLLHLLEPELVGSGTLPRTGGAVVSADGAIGIQVDADQLASDIPIEIYRAVTPSGLIKLRMVSNRDFSSLAVSTTSHQATISDETALVRITYNVEQLYNAEQLEVLTANSTPPYVTPSGSSYPLTHEVASRAGLFATLGSEGAGRRWATFDGSLGDFARVCNRFNVFCLDLDPHAATLRSSKPVDCFGLEPGADVPDGCSTSDPGGSFQPVLFIHGYNPGGQLGGGEGTWGEFPQIVSTMSTPDGDRIVPFEFRWRTNASFRVVANDLHAAIERIYNLTGKPVHVVAHSFGGLLVRTLLKNEGYTSTGLRPSFDSSLVLSVFTLGTPHSGIFRNQGNGPSGRPFPNGQDFRYLYYCNQISCWQAGEAGLNPPVDLFDSLRRFDGGVLGGLVDLIATPPITESIPIIAGLGLEREEGRNNLYGDGDKLISFDGQRISPDLVGSRRLATCDDLLLGPVTEIVLGPLDSDGFSLGFPRPGGMPEIDPLTGDMAFGYSHSKVIFLAPDDRFEYAEPYVSACDTGNDACQKHAALAIFENILAGSAAGAVSSYCIQPISRTPPVSMNGYLGTYIAEAPEEGVEQTRRYTRVIGPGPEIYGGELQALDGSQNLLRSTTDFGNNTIQATYIDGGRTATFPFNGIVYRFESTAPAIVSATLDPSSDLSPDQARVSLDDSHTVRVNLSGVPISEGDRFLINLELSR